MWIAKSRLLSSRLFPMFRRFRPVRVFLWCLLGASWGLVEGCGSTDADVVRVPIGDSPVRGPSDAWVTVVEFADFQCSFCAESEPLVRALVDAHTADVRLVFKHFPLPSIHENALGAAVAAECARAQDAFWPFHDLLFEHRTALGPESLPSLAEMAGLDVEAWNACLETSEPQMRVDRDKTLGLSLGVDATPTLIVNGTPIVGVPEDGELEAVTEHAMSAAQDSGIDRAEYYDRAILGL